MTDTILTDYEIRKSNKEKSRFIDYLKERLSEKGYDKEKDITIETKGKGIFKSRNIVVGNPEKAEIFITAHYDTCAVIPFPNLMAPTNPFIFIMYQIVLVVLILLMAGLVAVPVMLLTKNALVTYYAFLLFLWGLIIHIMVGYRNAHTANDNTSGVITITKILEELSPEQRQKVCAVYFDNEEKGLFGSALFAKKHKKAVKDKLLINFDCVGDGEYVVTMAKKEARKDIRYVAFVEAFEQSAENREVKYLCRKMKPMMFPSDQSNFSKSIGICALKKSPIGLYTARIHTPFDTKCREENIDYLGCAIQAFLDKI